MSATLPKISTLAITSEQPDGDSFVHLVKNRNGFYQNPNFRERVTFRFDYIDKQLSWEELASTVQKHAEEYFARTGTAKVIVECITKRSAHRLFEIIENSPEFSAYKKFILSGTVLEPRRQEVVNFLKSQEANRGQTIVVTTQVIEAGMDIDMDLGFKDKSILDSEEQFAGRINRNAAKPRAELFLFNSTDSLRTYRADLRHKQRIELDVYKEILLNKDFDRFYDLVLESINRSNRDQFMAGNAADFQAQLRMLRFRNVNDQFQLIRENTVSVFVPLALPANHFSADDLSLLGSLGLDAAHSAVVNGEDVWNLYCGLVENESVSFIDRKINLKMMSSIIAKYTFSVWNNPQQINILRTYTDTAEPKYGFYYLQHYADIYSYENGLKADIETDSNFF